MTLRIHNMALGGIAGYALPLDKVPGSYRPDKRRDNVHPDSEDVLRVVHKFSGPSGYCLMLGEIVISGPRRREDFNVV